jgi:hypothetical protein
MDPSIVQHIEKYLGRIQEGWSVNFDGKDMPFQIVRLDGNDNKEEKYFSTLGLSNYPLQSSRTKKTIRCELVMCSRNSSGTLPAILQDVGLELIQSGRALLRGDVIGPRNSLVRGSTMTALYASIPVQFPPNFGSCTIDKLGTVVFIWLIPIATDEVIFIEKNGWAAFEDLLEKENPDLNDICRASIFTNQ